MGVLFDTYNKWILIESPTVDITALEIYSAAMDWSDNSENLAWLPPMSAIGKFGMGSGVYSDSIFIINASDGWKIKPWSGTYQLVIRGTIITDDESARTVPPDFGTVGVIFQVSSQGLIIAQGSGVTPQDKLDIADRVWKQSLVGYDTSGTFGGFLQKKLLTFVKFLGFK